MSLTPERLEKLFDKLEATTVKLTQVAGELKSVADKQVAVSESVAELRKSVEANKAAIAVVRSDLDKWVNRGWGAWGVIFLLFTIVTAVDWSSGTSWVAKIVPPHVQLERDLRSQSTEGK